MRSPLAAKLLAIAALFAPQFGLAQTCVEPPSGVVSWWPAEDDAEDIIGDNDGALQGTATFAPGTVGSGFLFDGSDDHVLAADDPSLNPQAMTLEVWIQTTEVDNHFIVSKSGTTGTSGYELGVGLVSGGRPRFTLNGGLSGATDVHGTSVLADGQFHNIVATFDGARSKIYVDGVLEGRQLSSTTTLYEADSQLFIGARELGGIPGFWPGIVDELTLYSRALCAAEIEAIYNAGSLGKCDGGQVVICPVFVDNFELGDLGEWSTVVQ